VSRHRETFHIGVGARHFLGISTDDVGPLVRPASKGKWASSERDEKRAAARALGVAVELHYLDVPFEELRRRLMASEASNPDLKLSPPQRQAWLQWLPSGGAVESGCRGLGKRNQPGASYVGDEALEQRSTDSLTLAPP